MTSTARLELPLLQAAQAQKHVTVNEALGRLDGLCQMTLMAVDQQVPPVSPAEGEAWGLGPAPTDAWTGQANKVAMFQNGGWVFFAPRPGWRAWCVEDGGPSLFDGVAWQTGAVAVSTSGAATVADVIETDVVVTPGSYVDTAALIPSGSIVQAVTGRVVSEITGDAVSWRLGVEGSGDRYGTGYGMLAGSWARGLTGQPQAYWSDTALRISAEGGTFTGGQLRLAVHLTRFSLPRG